MAHQQQKDFCLSVKNKFPSFFRDKLVLDIGSLDINGNNQYLFENSGYIGIDLLPGRNVDFTSKGHELQFPDESFDVIISTECFEHDPFYAKTINNIVRMLKPGGLFLFSCATTGRPEHGTRRTTPEDAPFTHEFGEWGDYYKNLDENDIREVIKIDEIFFDFEFSVQNDTFDIYFWGLKRGDFVPRNNYSFQTSGGVYQRLVEKINKTESEIFEIRKNFQILEAKHKLIESEFDKNKSLLEKIKKSSSWKLTRPFRVFARLLRGEFSTALGPLLKNDRENNSFGMLFRIKNALRYIFRGDFKGLRDRISSLRNEALVSHWQAKYKNSKDIKWGVLTPPHTLFIGHLIAEKLSSLGWEVEIMTSAPKVFSSDLYIVICPQVFDRLPPGGKRIAFQLEQAVSSRWFTEKYFKILESSLAVIEYSLYNIGFLESKGIAYPHVHYLPIGASASYGSSINSDSKKYDVLFYGDSLSSPRRRHMLDALKAHFEVHVVNNVFGEGVIAAIKQARVVVNIHYYENALLETPRIQECLSLGVAVVSESTKDQNEYPELLEAVTFFDEGSVEGMVAAVRHALSEESTAIEKSVIASGLRFSFMFDRLLMAIKLLPATHVKNINLPLPPNSSVFGLSLPETARRRQVFEDIRPADCITFDGIRYQPGWIGCGLSYSALARHALNNGLRNITVMEDDVILPDDYCDALLVIRQYLAKSEGAWDVFAGVIASLHSDAEVIAVEEFNGRKFVTIDKMTSMVFNIYSENILRLFLVWDPDNHNADLNTIDRFLESQKNIRVVTTLPYFVGHREEVYSTLWGFENSRYNQMIEDSELLLGKKVDAFLASRYQ